LQSSPENVVVKLLPPANAAGNAFGCVCLCVFVCVSVCLFVLQWLCSNFWKPLPITSKLRIRYTGTHSEYLGQNCMSGSSGQGQGQGHRSKKTKYTLITKYTHSLVVRLRLIKNPVLLLFHFSDKMWQNTTSNVTAVTEVRSASFRLVTERCH